MKAMIQFPLDLPDVEVLGTELTARGELMIRVESTREGTVCRRCGRAIKSFHGHDEAIQLRHLPILDRPVYIELQPKRYRCPYCEDHPTTTQRCDWYRPKSPYTLAYEQYILRELINSTAVDVSRKQGLTEEAIDGILDRHIATEVDWERFSRLDKLGLDEIALRKGHQQYVTIVSTELATGPVVVLGVLPNREKATVKAFLEAIPERLKATIRRVCTDMYEGFVNAVREALPNAEVVVDRFHVAKGYRAGVDQLRKQEMDRLRETLPEAAYESIQGTLWLFRKRWTELAEDEQSRLARVFLYSPDLEKAYVLREGLTLIFDHATSKTHATQALQVWREQVEKSGLRCFDRFLTTLDNWTDEITNYFHDRQTSGFVEGLNNKIKVLKRRCYGRLSVRRLFQRLFLDLEGYPLLGCP